jgi:hypothetical protein
MKTFFFLISFTFCSLAFSQGNLQFNKVLTYNGLINGSNSLISSNGTYVNASVKYTVPTNKVWKIEYAYFTNGYLFFNNFQSTNSSNFITSSPIWLKAGDTLQFGAAGEGHFFISIIEFNIVP